MATAADQLLAQIRSATEQLRSKELVLDEAQRGALWEASQKLTAAVEKPINAVHKLVFAVSRRRAKG
jgi:hypothetical protein